MPAVVSAPWKFLLYSDIDLAARGIAPDKFFTASAAIKRVDVNFQIDLAELESCSPAVHKNIEKTANLF